MHAELKTIPIDLIKRGQFQPRTEFAAGALDDLAESIREVGMVEPIIVRPCGDTYYEIIAGERRWRAAGLAQLENIGCLVGKYSDVVCRKIGLIENIQRENLNVMEVAKALQDLMEEELLTQEEAASAIGKSRSYVANVVAVLRLPERLQKALRAGDLDFGHAKALMGLAEGNQIDLAQKAMTQGWSVRRIEQAAKSLNNKPGRARECSIDNDLERYVMEQSEKIGSPLDISSPKKGQYKVSLTFYSVDELDGFFSRIK
jgi:ParB family transcriptional regulator, chromosome partitioning protein